MIVQLDKLSARAALDSLAECHDWVWRETEKGVIVVERPHIPVPSSLLDVSGASARAIPLDMRRFIGIGPQGSLRADYVSQHRDTPRNAIDALPSSIMLVQRLAPHKAKIQESFIASITPRFCTGKKVPYNDWAPEQKQDLLDMFVLDAFCDICSSTKGAPLLICGQLSPERLDANRMVVYSNGGDDLIVATGRHSGVLAFGETIGLSKGDTDPLAGIRHR